MSSRRYRRIEIKFFYRIFMILFAVMIGVSLFKDIMQTLSFDILTADSSKISSYMEIHNLRQVKPQQPQQQSQQQQSQNSQQQSQQQPQQQDVKYKNIEGKSLRKNNGVMLVHAGKIHIIIVLPETGYYTIKIYGDDITAGLRGQTAIKISYDVFTWTFTDKIALEFHDTFSVVGTKITAVYVAPPGYITYLGLNITAKMRRNIFPE